MTAQFEPSIANIARAAGACALAVLISSGWCAAGEIDRAKAHFLEGIELVEQEKYEQALAAFEASYGIRPKESVLFNIGMCQKALLRWGDAISTFQTYLKSEGAISSAQQQDAKEALNEMMGLVGSVTIEGAPVNALVFVDGREVGVIPLAEPLVLNPGTHTLSVGMSAEESPLLIRSVVIASGEKKVVKCYTEEPKTRSREDGEARKRELLLKSGWGLFGVGGIVALGGMIPGIMALSINKDLESDCSDGGCPPNVHDRLDERDNLATAATVMIVTGAVIATTGVVLISLSRPKDEEKAPPVSFAPAVTPQFAGATVTWRFH